jgi:hypothetical protein
VTPPLKPRKSQNEDGGCAGFEVQGIGLAPAWCTYLCLRTMTVRARLFDVR